MHTFQYEEKKVGSTTASNCDELAQGKMLRQSAVNVAAATKCHEYGAANRCDKVLRVRSEYL